MPTQSELEIVRNAVALLRSLGGKPTIRAIDAVIKVADGKRGMRWQTIAVALKNVAGQQVGQQPGTDGQQNDEEPATAGQHTETATRERADLSRVVIDSAQGLDSNPPPPSPSQAETADSTPALFAVPEPATKPPKPARIISAYAGTTLEDFGNLAPLVTAVLAVDGHGTETKAFAKSLETLAMWRALYGDAALAYGLGEAASRHKGHRYVGPCAKGYDPDEHRAPMRVVPGAAQPERDEAEVPTRLELVALGVAQPIGPDDIEPWMRIPTSPLYRPWSADLERSWRASHPIAAQA
jgi:hypothetical protein